MEELKNDKIEFPSEFLVVKKNRFIQKLVFAGAALLCLTPIISPPYALLLGLLVAQLFGNPFLILNNKIVKILLQASVVGLGFGMNVNSAMNAGKEGVAFTVFSITVTLIVGFLIGYFLKIDKKTSYLISSGTAICGGSAIAAVSPIIQANDKQISVALGTVFILNSVALFLFPYIGSVLNLSQSQFGLWCAIAIHDTSSVVGAASTYGEHALEVATTVKLARALWIIPVSFISAFFFRTSKTKVKIPYFIGLFVLALIINTYIPNIELVSHCIVAASKAGLTLTLFLIGSGLTMKVLQSVGIKPFIQGALLWILILSISLWFIVAFI